MALSYLMWGIFTGGASSIALLTMGAGLLPAALAFSLIGTASALFLMLSDAMTHDNLNA